MGGFSIVSLPGCFLKLHNVHEVACELTTDSIGNDIFGTDRLLGLGDDLVRECREGWFSSCHMVLSLRSCNVLHHDWLTLTGWLQRGWAGLPVIELSVETISCK